MKNITRKGLYYTARVLFTIGVIALVISFLVKVFTPNCYHDNIRYEYSVWTPNNGGYQWYKKHYCKDCGTYRGITYLHTNSEDSSCLSVLREHIDADELIDGEYYTLTAIVVFANYGTNTSVTCKVQDDDITVHLSVDFREEFKDAVSYSVLESGDEITFRGKFDGIGWKWTDCELIG